MLPINREPDKLEVGDKVQFEIYHDFMFIGKITEFTKYGECWITSADGHNAHPFIGMVQKLQSSDKWMKELDDYILDPDGWDRKNYQYSFNEEEITREEYEGRYMCSTVKLQGERLRKLRAKLENNDG